MANQYYRDKFDSNFLYKAVAEKGIFTILKGVSYKDGQEVLSPGEIYCVPSHLRDLYEKCGAPA